MNLDIRKALASHFGNSYSVGKYPPLNKMSTGIIGLDLILGGGLPMGRVLQIYGAESSCKTTLCLHLIKAIQEHSHHCGFVDTEYTFEEVRLDEIGIDKERFHLYRPSCGEQAIEFVIKSAEAGVKLIVVDSVPGLISKKAAESDVGDLNIASQARLLSAEFPKLVPVLAHNDCTVIFINQIRNKIGGYGDPTSLPGGGALKFYSSIILKLSRIEVLKNNAGVRIAAQTIKNKRCAFGQRTEFTVNWPLALVDKYSSMKECLQTAGLLVQKGSFFKFSDELGAEIGFSGSMQGAAKVCTYLAEHPDVYNRLYQSLLLTLEGNSSSAVEEIPNEEEEREESELIEETTSKPKA